MYKLSISVLSADKNLNEFSSKKASWCPNQFCHGPRAKERHTFEF